MEPGMVSLPQLNPSNHKQASVIAVTQCSAASSMSQRSSLLAPMASWGALVAAAGQLRGASLLLHLTQPTLRPHAPAHPGGRSLTSAAKNKSTS
jgi:hypothetical protein